MLYEISYIDKEEKKVTVGITETKQGAYDLMCDYVTETETHDMPYTIKEMEGRLQ